MRTPFAGAVAAVRQPEYTGENRCLPCTGVNVVIAVVAAAAIGYLLPVEEGLAVAIGGVVLLAAGIVIYLRGYLVPGTPWLTQTYFPDWFLRYFEHGEGTAPMADVDPAAVLETAGAIDECEEIDDLCLTDDFRTEWHARMDQLQAADASRADLAAILDVPADALAFETHGSAFVAIADGGELPDLPSNGRRRVGQWESRGAFLADMAAAGVIGQRYDDWDRLSPPQRGRVLNGLRLFLERCPSCGGAATIDEETVKSCCRSRDVVAVTCDECGDRLFEVEQPAAA